MSLVGKQAPDFELMGYYKKEFKPYKLSDFRGKWVFLLFYPLDFTFVCPTEVLAFSKAAKDFRERNCEILGISVDSHFVHKAWVDADYADGGLGGDLEFPLLGDLGKKVSADYGVLDENAGVALRGLFLIDPEGTVQHVTINNLSVGRSTKEALRVLKSFQYVTSHEGEVCPADWDEGMDTMKADPEEMKKFLAEHH